MVGIDHLASDAMMVSLVPNPAVLSESRVTSSVVPGLVIERIFSLDRRCGAPNRTQQLLAIVARNLSREGEADDTPRPPEDLVNGQLLGDTLCAVSAAHMIREPQTH